MPRCVHKIRDKACRNCGADYKAYGRSVYCSHKCNHKDYYNKNMLSAEFRLNKLMGMAKNRAKDKGLDFDLTSEYLKSLWDKTEGRCQVSSIPFELTRPEFGKVHPYAPSIDRIEPLKGYTQGNVRLIVYQLNVALSEFGLAQFDDFIKLYTSFK